MSRMQLDAKGVRTPCQACEAWNRLAYGKLGQPARCARCQAPIAHPAEPIEVPSPEVFDALVAGSSLPVLVDFWATWCPPCRMVAPELEKVARARSGTALVVKVDTDALASLSARFEIRSVPTLAVFVDGRETTRTAGAMPAASIQEMLG